MAPENTLASIRLALKQGADYIENDIMRTKDGALVVTHDLSLARTTNVEQVFPDRAPWNVADFTLSEVKQLDAGSCFGSSFAGERILTLREWVEAVGGRAGMLLEAKDPWAFPGIELEIDKELRSIPAFTKALAADRVLMQAGDQAWLRRYHDLAPDVPVALLHYGIPTDEELVAGSLWLDAFNPALGNMNQTMVERIHELGMETHVWTVNFGGDMNRAISGASTGSSPTTRACCTTSSRAEFPSRTTQLRAGLAWSRHPVDHLDTQWMTRGPSEVARCVEAQSWGWTEPNPRSPRGHSPHCHPHRAADPASAPVWFRSDDLSAFEGNVSTDRYVKLVFPKPGVDYPEPLDMRALRGTIPPEDMPVVRTYTALFPDVAAGTLAIDFVVHGDEGVAGPWAAAAQPGDTLIANGPGRWLSA